jgi:hypothetical protein
MPGDRGLAAILADSVTDLSFGAAAGRLVACGSHGGQIAGEIALHAGVSGIVFNDAGVGRDRAGLAGLELLAGAGVPAAAVSHACARIGNADDTFTAPLLHLNRIALELGWRAGASLQGAADAMLGCAPSRSARRSTRPTEAVHQLPELGGRVWALDSASLVDDRHRGCVVVTGSHGGLPGGLETRALKVPALAAVFNDAGGGKDGAGWSRLAPLDRLGVPAGTVSCATARIGDALSTFYDGVLSRVNDAAADRGALRGMSCRDFIALFVDVV